MPITRRALLPYALFPLLGAALPACLLGEAGGDAPGDAPALPDPFAGDARLERKVLVSCEGLPVSELLALISEKTQIPLSASREHAQDKLLVFGPARPLRDVLADLAALLGAVWEKRKTDTGYTLARSIRTRNREERLQRDTTGRMLEHMDAQVKALSETPEQLARRPPQDRIRQRLADPGGRLGTHFFALLTRAQKEKLFKEGRLSFPFSALSEGQKDSLRKAFRGIVAEEERFAQEQRAKGFGVPVSRMEDLERGRLRFQLTQGGATSLLLVLNRSPKGALFLSFFDPRGRWLAPARGNPYTAEPVPEGSPLPPPRAVGEAARGDKSWPQRLRALSEAAGVPVLADFYRSRPVTAVLTEPTGASPAVSAPDAGSALDALCRPAGYLWWARGDTLLLRKRDWYNQRQYEVPERWLREVSRGLRARDGLPTVRDVLRVGELTQRQVAGLNAMGGGAGFYGDEYRLAGLSELLAAVQAASSGGRADEPVHTGPISREVERHKTLVLRPAGAGEQALLRAFLARQSDQDDTAGETGLRVLLVANGPEAPAAPRAPEEGASGAAGYRSVRVLAIWEGEEAHRAKRPSHNVYPVLLPFWLPDERADKIHVELAP